MKPQRMSVWLFLLLSCHQILAKEGIPFAQNVPLTIFHHNGQSSQPFRHTCALCLAAARGCIRRSLIDFCNPGDVWRNPQARLADRVTDLLELLTVDEMISSLDANKRPSGAIKRLGIPGFTGWNGRSHLQRRGKSCTVGFELVLVLPFRFSGYLQTWSPQVGHASEE